MVMFDQRLSCTAKVIYAYLASYSGAGQVSFPKVAVICRHLGLSENSFRKHMKQLVDTNYISRVQRHINGRLASNSYHLNDCPDTAAADKGRTIVVQYPKTVPRYSHPKLKPRKINPRENNPRISSPRQNRPRKINLRVFSPRFLRPLLSSVLLTTFLLATILQSTDAIIGRME